MRRLAVIYLAPRAAVAARRVVERGVTMAPATERRHDAAGNSFSGLTRPLVQRRPSP